MGFTIRRGKLPTDQFTIIPNAYLRDDRLAWQTRGLLGWLMGHTDDFEITEEAMIAAGGVQEGFRGGGRDGVRKMVGQLEDVGYLRRDKTFTPGMGTTVTYVLTDPDDGLTVASDDGLTVARADQGKQEDLAGQPDDGLAVPPSYKEDQEKNQKTSSSGRAPRSDGGTRLPDDFIPTQQLRDWFADEKLHHVIDARIEHEKFMDYWRAVPGVKGRKKDWPATWRNWMRTAADRSGRRPVSAPPGTSLMPSSGVPSTYRPSTTDQKIAQTLELGRRLQQQMEESQ